MQTMKTLIRLYQLESLSGADNEDSNQTVPTGVFVGYTSEGTFSQTAIHFKICIC